MIKLLNIQYIRSISIVLWFIHFFKLSHPFLVGVFLCILNLCKLITLGSPRRWPISKRAISRSVKCPPRIRPIVRPVGFHGQSEQRKGSDISDPKPELKGQKISLCWLQHSPFWHMQSFSGWLHSYDHRLLHDTYEKIRILVISLSKYFLAVSTFNNFFVLGNVQRNS